MKIALRTSTHPLINEHNGFKDSCLFLKHMKKRKTPNYRWSAGELKHQVEYMSHGLYDYAKRNCYVMPDVFINAAIHMGFEWFRRNGRIYFNISEKSMNWMKKDKEGGYGAVNHTLATMEKEGADA